LTSKTRAKARDDNPVSQMAIDVGRVAIGKTRAKARDYGPLSPMATM
jgi:hypothetical protein